MPLFQIKQSNNIGAQALADSAQVSAEVVGRLEDREETSRLRSAELDQSADRARLYAENQRANRELRGQELSFARQTAVERSQTRRFELQQERAELYSDPDVSSAFAFLENDDPDAAAALELMDPSDPVFWRTVGRAKLDAEIAETDKAVEDALGITGRLEKQDLVGPGTSEEVALAILNGENPSAVVAKARERVAKLAEFNRQKKAVQAEHVRGTEVWNFKPFIESQGVEDKATADGLLSDLAFYAETDPGHPRVEEIRSELKDLATPAEVREANAEREEYIALLEAKDQARTDGQEQADAARVLPFADPAVQPGRSPVEEMEAARRGQVLEPESVEIARAKAVPVAKLKPAKRIEAGNALVAWLNDPATLGLSPEEEEAALEIIMLQIGIKGSIAEVEALMGEAQAAGVAAAPPGDPILEARERAKASGRYGTVGNKF